MFESIGRSFELVKTSWNILMDDKKLLAFPIFSGIVTILVILTFALPLIGSNVFAGGSIIFYGILFLFYMASYFVVIFFNTALISCVNAKLNGRDMSISEGISNSAKHLPAILGWAIVSATVGIVLHILERRSGWIGQIVLSLIGGAWALVTYFVVPILILEDKGVFASLGESFALIKKTWGESIVGSVGIAIVFVAIGAIAAFGVVATLLFGMPIIIGIALFLFVVIVLAVIYSAMQGIYVTALYTYAKTGTVPSAFNSDLIRNAFAQKQAGPGNI